LSIVIFKTLTFHKVV